MSNASTIEAFINELSLIYDRMQFSIDNPEGKIIPAADGTLYKYTYDDLLGFIRTNWKNKKKIAKYIDLLTGAKDGNHPTTKKIKGLLEKYKILPIPVQNNRSANQLNTNSAPVALVAPPQDFSGNATVLAAIPLTYLPKGTFSMPVITKLYKELQSRLQFALLDVLSREYSNQAEYVQQMFKVNNAPGVEYKETDIVPLITQDYRNLVENYTTHMKDVCFQEYLVDALNRLNTRITEQQKQRTNAAMTKDELVGQTIDSIVEGITKGITDIEIRKMKQDNGSFSNTSVAGIWRENLELSTTGDRAIGFKGTDGSKYPKCQKKLAAQATNSNQTRQKAAQKRNANAKTIATTIAKRPLSYLPTKIGFNTRKKRQYRDIEAEIAEYLQQKFKDNNRLDTAAILKEIDTPCFKEFITEYIRFRRDDPNPNAKLKAVNVANYLAAGCFNALYQRMNEISTQLNLDTEVPNREYIKKELEKYIELYLKYSNSSELRSDGIEKLPEFKEYTMNRYYTSVPNQGINAEIERLERQSTLNNTNTSHLQYLRGEKGRRKRTGTNVPLRSAPKPAIYPNVPQSAPNPVIKKPIQDRIADGSVIMPHGYTRIPISPDGNCLFGAIADQFIGNPDQHLYFRELAMRGIKIDSSIGEDSEFLIPQNNGNAISKTKYIEEYSKSGLYGGELEVKILSVILGCNIHIWIIEGNQVTDSTTLSSIINPSSNRNINLLYYGELSGFPHYDSLHQNGVTYPLFKGTLPPLPDINKNDLIEDMKSLVKQLKSVSPPPNKPTPPPNKPPPPRPPPPPPLRKISEEESEEETHAFITPAKSPPPLLPITSRGIRPSRKTLPGAMFQGTPQEQWAEAKKMAAAKAASTKGGKRTTKKLKRNRRKTRKSKLRI